MTGAGSDSCTVTLSSAAGSGGLSVGLTSSSAAVTVPATVVVPANATSAGFTATVSSVTTAQAVTLTASAGSVSKSFALQLNAAVPTLTVSPTSLAFGNVTVNTASTLPVTLTSTGTAPVTINSANIERDWLHDVGSHLPCDLESDPVGDAECAVRSDRGGSGDGSADDPEQLVDQRYGGDQPDGHRHGGCGSLEWADLQQRVDDGRGKRYLHGDAERG